MTDSLCATDLRRWAAQCAERAAALTCDEDRERLAKMRDAFLALAENADWLAGTAAAK